MIIKALATITGWIAGLLLGVMTIILLAGILGRYSGFYSLVWVEEMVRAMFTWISFLGAAIGVQQGAHFRLGIIDDHLPAPWVRTVRMLAQLALALLGLAMLVLGWQLAEDSGFFSTNILKISFTLIYAVIPVSGALFIVFALDHMLREWRSSGAPPPAQGSVQ